MAQFRYNHGMSKKHFHTAAVIGTGMMGPGIAGSLALGGLHATILSRTEETAAQGLDTARAQLGILAENGLAETADVREVALPVLQHRVITNYRATGAGKKSRDIVQSILGQVKEKSY